MGLSVPVADVLNPRLWRERYAYGLIVGRPPPDGSTLAERLAASIAAAQNPTAAATVAGLPDDLIRWHLRCALSELEVKLEYPMGIEVIKGDPVDPGLVLGTDYDRIEPRRPYTQSGVNNWYRLDVPGPVVSVQRIRAFYFDNLVFTTTEEEADGTSIEVTHPKQGTIQILPLQTVLTLITRSGWYGSANLLLMNQAQASPIPAVWSIDYTRGPVADDGTPGHIEAVLANWCYAVAGMTILGIDGLARSRGITSTSLSMDGVSRSISMQPNLNGTLIDYFDKLTQRIDWKAIKSFKKGIRLIPFGY